MDGYGGAVTGAASWDVSRHERLPSADDRRPLLDDDDRRRLHAIIGTPAPVAHTPELVEPARALALETRTADAVEIHRGAEPDVGPPSLVEMVQDLSRTMSELSSRLAMVEARGLDDGSQSLVDVDRKLDKMLDTAAVLDQLHDDVRQIIRRLSRLERALIGDVT
jgi:hypothetical protein